MCLFVSGRYAMIGANAVFKTGLAGNTLAGRFDSFPPPPQCPSVAFCSAHFQASVPSHELVYKQSSSATHVILNEVKDLARCFAPAAFAQTL